MNIVEQCFEVEAMSNEVQDKQIIQTITLDSVDEFFRCPSCINDLKLSVKGKVSLIIMDLLVECPFCKQSIEVKMS